MKFYQFIYQETQDNKNFWKAIRCTEMTVKTISDGFKLVTIIEPTEEELEKVIDRNYSIIEAMMSL